MKVRDAQGSGGRKLKKMTRINRKLKHIVCIVEDDFVGGNGAPR